MIGDMTIDFNQQHSARTFPLTATGHDTPYYAHGRSTPLVQQQEGRDIQPMPMVVHTSTMSPHHETMNQQHVSSFLSSPASSSATDEYVDNDPDSQAYCNYLYQFGFLQGDFSDITVSIPNIGQTFALHSLIICRSPYFYQRLIHLQHHRGTRLMLELDYKPVMAESFRVALTHLYRPLSRQELICMNNKNPCLTMELIGIAEYLGLVTLKDGLIHVALSQDFDQTSAMQWIHCLHTHSSSQSQLWIHALENRLLLYLARDLPAQVMAFPASLVKVNTNMTIGKHYTRGYMPSKSTSLPGMTDLAQLYSTLPWTYVRRCLEHPDLPIQDTLQRYCFAQKISELKSSAAVSHEHFIFGLRFSNNGKQHHQPGTHNAMTGLSFTKATPRKLGKWDPSLYEFKSDEGDDRRFVVL